MEKKIAVCILVNNKGQEHKGGMGVVFLEIYLCEKGLKFS